MLRFWDATLPAPLFPLAVFVIGRLHAHSLRPPPKALRW